MQPVDGCLRGKAASLCVIDEVPDTLAYDTEWRRVLFDLFVALEDDDRDGDKGLLPSDLLLERLDRRDEQVAEGR